MPIGQSYAGLIQDDIATEEMLEREFEQKMASLPVRVCGAIWASIKGPTKSVRIV